MLQEAISPKQKNAVPVKRYRIAFLSQDNPQDQRTWSGITYHLHKQIGQHHDLTWIHANDLSLTNRRILSVWNKLTKRLGWKFTSHHFLNASFLAKRIRQKLRQRPYDFVVVGAGESELIAYLKTNIPIIYIADTTFGNMVNYYPWHTGLSKLALIQGNNIEKKAIQNAAHLIYTSTWAADSAVQVYGAKKERITLLNFGANLLQIPDKESIDAKAPGTDFHLLFLGVQWERKGGPIVYGTFRELKNRGLDCRLTIIGCDPALAELADITIIPFLDKNEKEDASRLFDILMDVDILFVPTRADCTPVVFSEAAAFGIPVVTTQTGGVSSVVKDGVNGYCLPLEATASDYANVIERIWTNKDLYSKLKNSSRSEYDRRLNWERWIEGFNSILAKTSQ